VGLLDVSDLEPLDQKALLNRAETLVAQAICPQLTGLETQVWTAEVRIRNDLRAFGVPLYGKRRLGPEALRVWPITGLTSISQDGTDIKAECTFDRFSIRRDAFSPEFSPLGLIAVVFQTGWEAYELPEQIKEAVLLTLQTLQATPVGIVSERIGDVQTTYRATPGAMPAEALNLLSSWRYPGV